MELEITDTNLQFLAGGGEMGELIRSKNWSKTSIGTPDTWSAGLRTTLSILLNSKFPMFLWWGPDLICFYNDAYRPSLGQNGKHPDILGMKASEAWSEIWEIIKPLIDQVLSGDEATWSENQLVPIFRNGKIEDVYWTFSYSPVKDEEGNIGGVLVVCNETTETVNTFRSLEESNRRYFNNIMQAPVAMCIFRGKNYLVEIANASMLELWNKTSEEVMNKPIFEGLPEAKGQGLEELMDNVYRTGVRYVANERLVKLPRNGKIENTYINFVYEALREPDSSISGIVATASEVTEQVMSRKKVEESSRNLRNMVLQAPIGICILDAATLICEIVNNSFIEVAGKPYEAIAGKYYWDTFAEAKPYYETALKQVVEEGKPFYANEVELMLIRHGKEEVIYVTFVYAPLKNEEGKVNKIAVWVIENTQQVIGRQKIGEAEERLRLATAAGGIATFDLHLESREIIYSDSLSEIFGLDKGRKYTHPELRSILHPDDLNEIIQAFDSAMQTGTLQYEARVVKPGNVIGWVRTQGKVYFNDAKKAVKMVGTIRDITTEKYREQELFESEKNLRLMIHQAPVSIGIFRGPDYVVEIANDRALELWGREEKELINKPFLEAMPELQSQGIKEVLDNVYNTGEPFWANELPIYILRKRKLETVYVNFSYDPLYKADGNINGVMVVGFDVTDQVIARKKIEENEQKLNVVIDASELGTWERDLSTGEISYSERYLEIFGHANGTVLNRLQLMSQLHPEDSHLREQADKEALITGIYYYESRLFWPDKSLHWIEVRGKLFYDEEKKPYKLIGTVRDTTDEKIFARELERQVQERTTELEQKNVELEKMNTELQSFAYVSSHDLQEPLRKIQTFTSRILEKENANLSETGKDYFSRMQKAANRMQTLINDLLTYSRTNTAQRVFSAVNLEDIINDVKAELKETLQEKQATIETRGTSIINVIPFQFKQLITNLVSNSLKFSKPNQPPHIIISSEITKGSNINIQSLNPQKKYCHITVSDNGIGFDPKYKDRIFEVFQRLHGKDEYSGTGIGLSIVKKIVENHNGIITATGVADNGATFDIYIPD